MATVADTIQHALKHISGALLDAWVVVDREQAILDFNPVFRGLFPRGVARQLRKLSFSEVIRLELAHQALPLAEECMGREMPLRYDEVVGHVAEGEEELSLIVSASPLVNDVQEVEGAFLTLRNVTDEAQVQIKYKSMLEEEARERELLQRRITSTEGELVDLKDEMAAVEGELLDFKKGLLV